MDYSGMLAVVYQIFSGCTIVGIVMHLEATAITNLIGQNHYKNCRAWFGAFTPALDRIINIVKYYLIVLSPVNSISFFNCNSMRPWDSCCRHVLINLAKSQDLASQVFRCQGGRPLYSKLNTSFINSWSISHIWKRDF